MRLTEIKLVTESQLGTRCRSTKMTTPVTCTMEFAVEGCPNKAKKCLEGQQGVKSVSIQAGSLLVESDLSASNINRIIESSGQRAVLQGYGGSIGAPNLASAVALMEVGVNSNYKGVVRFVQVDNSTCVIDGTLDGLMPGSYGVYLHEYGDISDGCRSCGDVFGKSSTDTRSIGEIGLIKSEDGRAEFRVSNENLKVWDIIGRSCVIHNKDNEERLLCGIVARSAGLFQNTKRICACDGVPVWDERNVPAAGTGRKSKI